MVYARNTMETLLKVLVIFFSVLLGAIVGSFLGAAVWRLKTGKSLARGHSICPNCKKQLGISDLVPLFSYVFLRGKCRYCNKKISPHYFITELLTATTFGTIGYLAIESTGIDLLTGFYSTLDTVLLVVVFGAVLGIAAILILVAIFDLWYMEVPERALPFLYIFTGVFAVAIGVLVLRESGVNLVEAFSDEALVTGWLFGIDRLSIWPVVINAALGAAIMFLFFFGMNRLTKGKGMGFGDVVFAPAVGLWLGGFLTLFALLASFILGSVVASIWALIKCHKIKGVLVPYLPFLCASALLVFVFSAEIMNWLVNYLILW